eukprot:TRINITY_DN4459_c0_g1_i1.p1 TRINITY_DN4459_c0_g1~~TRINITY_DN4459_c0_g1_i1.p1  ORF type:complete len:647 (+),score=93.45 TRINITY_DN4459_c0_g1_i1:71-2011(+)
MAPTFSYLAAWSAAVAVSTQANSDCRCMEVLDPCWPGAESWAALNTSVGGHLVTGQAAASPVAACKARSGGSPECTLALNRSKSTEFWNMMFSGGFQTTGLQGGFATVPSQYAIRAHSTRDVQEAIRFASAHNLRVAIKGAGHDYMGRNTAPSAASLMIATNPMQGVHWASDNATVTVEAGVSWQDVYMQAQARGRYVQGGHCPSVGAAGGFSLGAGYGPFSRMYGTGADNMLSATVVTADGEAVHADAKTNADLFWALRGGGGGTFGVVTNITYRTHVAPSLAGNLRGSVSCEDAGSFEELLVSFLQFAPQLFSPHWGDSVTPNALEKRLDVGLIYVGITEDVAKGIWQTFSDQVNNLKGCVWKAPLSFEPMPTIKLAGGAEYIKIYPYPGAHYPATGDPQVDSRLVDGFLEQVNQWSFGQGHRYIPQGEIKQDPRSVAKKLIELFSYPTTYRVLQFNKALAGGSGFGGDVSANPLVREAGVALMGNEHVGNYFPHLPETRETLANFIGGMNGYFSGGLCEAPTGDFDFSSCLTPALQSMSDAEVRQCWAGVKQCFAHRRTQFRNYTAALQKAFPTGSYANEGDYFEADWQKMFWGENYDRLRVVKNTVDPHGLFVCHHCVGSEDWSADGNCRLRPQMMAESIIV